MYKAKNKVFMDLNSVHKDHAVMWHLRRAYEHINFAKHHLDDMSSKYAPLKALTTSHNAYQNSNFFYSKSEHKVRGRKSFVISAMNNMPDLVLYGALQKSFPLHYYRNALEMISCTDSDTVYLDTRLDHHLVTNDEDLLFDAPLFLPIDQKTNFSTEYVVMRLQDLPTKTRRPILRTKPKGQDDMESCAKQNLLQPSSDDQYESNINLINCYAKDFLLWIIFQNPTLISTASKK